MSEMYDYSRLEPEWQRRWEEAGCFRAASPGQPGSEKPPYYVLDMFPYPSGAGLHVGHPLGYIASDIVSRYKRMRGFNVLHPMGWDAFGLPAEQYAIETGVHPAITTRKNIETYKRQLRIIGLSYDWSREIATCDESYYRWTQWIFLKIYNSWYDPEHRWTDAAGREVVGAARPIEQLPVPQHVKAEGDAAIAQFRDEHRLAYLAEVPVNWCPALGTVLSNEEVTADGRSDRGNHPVYRRPLKQWMLRITEYADRLLADLDGLEWPEPIKLMQRAWIGRSEGAYIDFKLDGADDVIRVYSTRPDTLYGATYLVLAPEHRLVNVITTAAQRGEVEAYVRAARQKSDLARTADSKVKTGVFTGGYAINPVNHARLPIWVADYVLGGYGTGSIMAVPGSDKRDLEFAEAFELPVVQVVEPPSGVAWRGFEGEGVAVHSPGAQTETGRPELGERFAGQCELNGLTTAEAKAKITQWLEERDLGEGTVQYKLRDWLFSRQRYWGEPFPIVYDERGLSEGVPESDLPVRLPPMDDFKPTASDNPDAEPQTPLSRATDWTTFERGGRKLRRELNTMPQWAGSCWYYLRFADASNERAMIDPGVEHYWAKQKTGGGAAKSGFVDLYLGGAEHAVLHLLYARFWHKVLYDLHVVSTPEPFQKLFNQGMIGAPSYRDERGVYAPAAEVTEGAEMEMFHPEDVDARALQAALARGLASVEANKAARVRVKTKFYYAGKPVLQTFDKMSKTKKNVVNPDEIIGEYGADTLRLYEMYMGPLDASKPWNTRDIVGVHRFLQRVWRLVVVGDGGEGWKLNPRLAEAQNESLEKLLHKTIKKVETDIEAFSFNTAIAQMIVWVNEATGAETIGRDQISRFLSVLCPFSPHLCEELHARLSGTIQPVLTPGGVADARRAGRGGGAGAVDSLSAATLLANAPWPAYDEALTRDDTVEMAVQVKGKVRGRVTVPTDASDEVIVAAAKAVDAVARDIAGKTIQRAIVVKGRLVNLIVQ